MAVDETQSGLTAITKREHHSDASAKKVIMRGQDPDTGDWVNIAAHDNEDGTFSLQTTATVVGGGDASAANQTNGNQKTQIVDSGGEAATVTGGKLDVNAEFSGTIESSPTFKDDPTDTEETPKYGKTNSTSHKQEVEAVVSGTVTANIGTVGTLATAAKQDTGNTSLASIDGKITAVNTGAVVVSSSALPSGAATAAKQPALGTAGTSSADVITVQGRAAMTPLLTDGSATTQPISGTVTANAGTGTMAVSNAGLTELATAINSDKLDVNIKSSDVATGGTSAADDADFTAGTTPGTPAMGVFESTPTSITDGDLGTVGITAARRLKTSATIDAALPAGTNAIGKLSANSGVDIGDVDVTSSALPTGASTSAKQDTIIGHLDGVETLLTDIESDTDTLAVVGGGTEATAQRVTIANDSTGVLSVDDNGSSLTVDNAGLTELAAAINSDKVDVNIASSGISFGGTSAADDADFTAGTTPGTPAMGVYEATPTTVTDGDLGTVGITTGRRLKTSATIDAALPAGTNNIGDVDVLSSALPTGASTSAKQDTIIGHLDGVEGLLTTIDGDTGTIAGAVDGSEMQVDIVSGAQTDALTDTELRAADVKVTLDGETVPVTGTFWQATQPISGTVTANLSATDNTVLDNIDTSTSRLAISGIGHGVTTVTTAGTDVALAGSTACKRVTIQSQTDNTGVIAVGATGVDATVATGTGILLFPGDIFELDIDNLADVFIDSSVNGEGVRYTYFT